MYISLLSGQILMCIILHCIPQALAVTYRHFYSQITFKETGSQAGNIFLVNELAFWLGLNTVADPLKASPLTTLSF